MTRHALTSSAGYVAGLRGRDKLRIRVGCFPGILLYIRASIARRAGKEWKLIRERVIWQRDGCGAARRRRLRVERRVCAVFTSCSLSSGISVMWAGVRARSYICVARALHKIVSPHLLYLEAGADHLAGDRGLVRFLDSLRHDGARARTLRATRAVSAAVLTGARLFLVTHGAGTHGCWTRELGWHWLAGDATQGVIKTPQNML